MLKLKLYKITAKNIEYLISKHVRAENINEAKEIFKTVFDNGEVPVSAAEIQFQEVKEVKDYVKEKTKKFFR